MDHDAVIIGASFSGLACAAALASRGVSVAVLDRKRSPGEKLHTTGILVRDVLDDVPLLDGLPAHLVRRIDQVRLHAPGMQYVDLAAPGYYFLATDTPGLMHWLANRAAEAGARMLWGCAFKDRFLQKIAPLFDFRDRQPVAVRAGLIPCGGVVHPVARPRALLIGDAAGMVSPVTAGGIHMALRHGASAGEAIAAFLNGFGEDPGVWAARAYPKFRIKRALRFLFDHCQTDWAFDFLLRSAPMRQLASRIYFHQRAS